MRALREYEEEDYSDDDGGEPEVAVPPPAADSWLAEQHGGIHFLNDSFSREMVPEDEESADVQSEGEDIIYPILHYDSQETFQKCKDRQRDEIALVVECVRKFRKPAQHIVVPSIVCFWPTRQTTYTTLGKRSVKIPCGARSR